MTPAPAAPTSRAADRPLSPPGQFDAVLGAAKPADTTGPPPSAV